LIFGFFFYINVNDDFSILAVQLDRLATVPALLFVVNTKAVARDEGLSVNSFDVDPDPHAHVGFELQLHFKASRPP